MQPITRNFLFVNGINTNYGGAGSGSYNFWINEIKKQDSVFSINLTPPLKNLSKKRFVQNIFYFIFHFPGAFFRLFRNPLFELFNKVSIFFTLYFLFHFVSKSFSSIIFSHHSSFYLQFFIPHSKRILLIHDILYERGKNFGIDRAFYRIIFSIELFFYKRARLILVQSYREYRILKSFLGNEKCFLIKSYPVNTKSINFYYYSAKVNHVALVADWRRSENINGLITFFSKPSSDNSKDFEITIDVWGYNSDVAVKKIKSIIKKHSKINFVNRGMYNLYEEVNAPIILILIYQGSGIKYKLLEALNSHKIVFSTSIGLKGFPIIKSNLIYKIHTINDIRKIQISASEEDYKNLLSVYNKKFTDITEVLNL